MFRQQRVVIVLCALVVAGAVGCSASGPQFQPTSLTGNDAAVYVYRNTRSYSGSGVILTVKVDDEQIGHLLNGGYLCRVVPPGAHVVSCATETKCEIPFQAEAGKAYYVDAVVEMGLFVGRPKLTMVPGEQGRLAILGTRLSK